MKFERSTIIGDIVRNHPEAIEVLQSFGMGCVGCPASQMESLEEAASVHGFDVEKLLQALNAN